MYDNVTLSHDMVYPINCCIINIYDDSVSVLHNLTIWLVGANVTLLLYMSDCYKYYIIRNYVWYPHILQCTMLVSISSYIALGAYMIDRK